MSSVKKVSTSSKMNTESSRKKSQPSKKSSVDSKNDRKTSNPRKSSQKTGDNNVIKTSLTVRLKSKNTESETQKIIPNGSFKRADELFIFTIFFQTKMFSANMQTQVTVPFLPPSLISRCRKTNQDSNFHPATIYSSFHIHYLTLFELFLR